MTRELILLLLLGLFIVHSNAQTKTKTPTLSATITRGVVECSALHAGWEVSCSVQVMGVGEVVLSPYTVKFDFLTDGTGIEVCPLPSLRQVNSSTLEFTWIPQSAGRYGALRLLITDPTDNSYIPLEIMDNEFARSYWEAVPGGNGVPQRTTIQRGRTTVYIEGDDRSVLHFFVLPPLLNNTCTNQLDIMSFAPTTDFEFPPSLPDWPGWFNGSEWNVQSLTLKPTSTSGAISQTVPIPAYSERCRFVVHYFFTGNESLDNPSFIGRASVVATDGSSDIATLKTFTLYSVGNKIEIEGGNTRQRNMLDGDIRNMEQIAHEFIILGSYTHLRAELEIDHSSNSELYFIDPQLNCATQDFSQTHVSDITALKRIYDSVGGPTSLLVWKNGAIWDGDPCNNNWPGVVCRHFRVTGLQLAGMNLQGQFPEITEMDWLEVIDLSHNNLQGRFFVNNSRLKSVDVSHNRITTLQIADLPLSAEASYHRTMCLQELRASHNLVRVLSPSLTRPPHMIFVDLSNNLMNSRVPTLEGMRLLEGVWLHSNFLYGTLPTLPTDYLISADFSQNQFNTTIPTQWGKLNAIRFLDVSKNAITGSIPTELRRIDTSRLLVFRAEDNILHGTLFNYNLSMVDIRNNHFECPLPLNSATWLDVHLRVVDLLRMGCDWLTP